MRVDFLGGKNAAFAILLKMETVKKLKKRRAKHKQVRNKDC
jgi:hypothetical protein